MDPHEIVKSGGRMEGTGIFRHSRKPNGASLNERSDRGAGRGISAPYLRLEMKNDLLKQFFLINCYQMVLSRLHMFLVSNTLSLGPTIM